MKLGHPPLVENAPLNLTVPRVNQVWSTDHRPDGHHADIYQHGRTVAAGDWKTYIPPASALVADSGTWTMTPGTSVVTVGYTRLGPPSEGALWIVCEITDTSTSATPIELRLTLPESLILTRSSRAAVRVEDNGTLQTVAGWVVATAGTRYLSFRRDGANTAFSAGTNNVSVQGEILVFVRETQR